MESMVVVPIVFFSVLLLPGILLFRLINKKLNLTVHLLEYPAVVFTFSLLLFALPCVAAYLLKIKLIFNS